MDIYCPRCAEPWDNDSLHEEAEASDRTYGEVNADFRAKGCKALSEAFGPQTCEPDERGESIAVVYEILGDDLDGASTFIGDARLA